MGQSWRVDDLGVQAYGDLWLNPRHGIRPHDGAEVAICSLSRGGFMVIDPKARTGIQVKRSVERGEGWAIGQGGDGVIWQTGFGARDQVPLLRWGWDSETSEVVRELPGKSYFTLDVGPDGAVYLPDYTSNTLHRYDPASDEVVSLGRFDEFGKHIRTIYAAVDGWLYVTAVDGLQAKVVAVNPATGMRQALEAMMDGPRHWQYGQLLKDGLGRVLIGSKRWGREFWHELKEGRIMPDPVPLPQLAATAIRQAATPPSTVTSPLAFRDGTSISRLENRSCEVTDASGESHVFELAREESPLRIFSLISGGGRIWGGTFIPLTLFSHDPATGESVSHDNPTRSTGEIYGMAWAAEKLFMASYTEANITRYEADRPCEPETSRQANPVHLGRMKEAGPPLHRIYGTVVTPDGMVYFAAKGDYGCEDSGLVRIDPRSEEITRWAYPATTFGALCHIPGRDELLVAERRGEERGLRFTRLDARRGEILAEPTIIDDEGQVISWLPAADGRVYGLHNHRATLFLYDPLAEEVVDQVAEMKVGDHCYNALIDGPDGRIWGLTNRCVYAVERDLSRVEAIAPYPDHAGGNFYRFGLCSGPDKAIYFANGTHLMRMSQS